MVTDNCKISEVQQTTTLFQIHSWSKVGVLSWATLLHCFPSGGDSGILASSIFLMLLSSAYRLQGYCGKENKYSKNTTTDYLNQCGNDTHHFCSPYISRTSHVASLRHKAARRQHHVQKESVDHQCQPATIYYIFQLLYDFDNSP